MRAWILTLIYLSFSLNVFSQEQLSLRLNEQGILKILKMALKYNTATKESRTLIIPQNIYKITLPKKKLLSNPIVPVVNEISDLNLDEDLDFFFANSPIKIIGNVNPKSLKANLLNSNKDGFDVRLSLEIPEIEIASDKLSLCEKKDGDSKTCDTGLRANLFGINVKTVGKPTRITVVLRLKTSGKFANLSIRSVNSNLEGKNSPTLDINFNSVEIPRIAVVIDGQEAELDTSRVKNEILKRRDFLASKLLGFAADFIASDVAEMINRYLSNKTIATSYRILSREGHVPFDEFLNSLPDDFYHQEDSANYVRVPQVIIQGDSDPFDEMMKQITALINKTKLNISLGKISTPGNKDIELSGLVDLMLNNQRMSVKNTLGNSRRSLPQLDMSKERSSDVNLAISEPLINGALDLINSTKIFQNIFESVSPVKGFSIKTVKIHFSQQQSVVAVVNAEVDLKQLKSKTIKEWFKNTIAAWLERNNNDSVIYFPIEISIIPHFIKNSKGGIDLKLEVKSPFDRINLTNTFAYPTNVPKMKESVKEGVMEELKESISPYTNKTYNFDVTEFFNKSGVVFLPKGMSINQGAYLMINLDILDIKFRARKNTLN